CVVRRYRLRALPGLRSLRAHRRHELCWSRRDRGAGVDHGRRTRHHRLGRPVPEPDHRHRVTPMPLPRLTPAVLALLLAAPAVHAEDYPTRPVRVVNPWPAGGSSDSVTRIVAQKLSGDLGQQIIVDNRPGATGTIGSASVAIAPADGYTLLLTTNSTTA